MLHKELGECQGLLKSFLRLLKEQMRESHLQASFNALEAGETRLYRLSRDHTLPLR